MSEPLTHIEIVQARACCEQVLDREADGPAFVIAQTAMRMLDEIVATREQTVRVRELLGRVIDGLILRGHDLTRVWEEALIHSGRYCEPYLRTPVPRPR